MHYAGALSLVGVAFAATASASSPVDPPTFSPPTLPPTLTPLFTLNVQGGDIQAPIPRLLGGYQSGETGGVYLQRLALTLK